MPTFVFTNHFRERWRERASLYGDETDADIIRAVRECEQMPHAPDGFFGSGDRVYFRHPSRGFVLTCSEQEPGRFVVKTVLTAQQIRDEPMKRVAGHHLVKMIPEIKPPVLTDGIEERRRQRADFDDDAAYLQWLRDEFGSAKAEEKSNRVPKSLKPKWKKYRLYLHDEIMATMLRMRRAGEKPENFSPGA